MIQNRPFKILIYTPIMASYGGIERHLCLFAILCARSGMDVTLLTTSNSLNEQARQEFRDEGVRFVEMPVERGHASSFRKLMWLLVTTLRLKATRWDVIYSNGQSGLSPIVWMARRRGTRVVHHHHTGGDAAEQKIWQRSYKYTLRKAPELVGCSLATKRELEAVLDRHDIRYLTCLTPPLIQADLVKDKVHSPDAILQFGYFGRLVSTKGIEEICSLSQMPELSGIRWHIYGQGDEYPEEYFKEFPHVTWHGSYRSTAEYAGILLGLDAAVLFSRHFEGLPVSLMEVMAAGLPWIATDRGGTRELGVSELNSVIVPAGASLQEMKVLTMELADRIRTGKTSRIAQRRVYDEHFSPEISSRKWLEYLRNAPVSGSIDA